MNSSRVGPHTRDWPSFERSGVGIVSEYDTPTRTIREYQAIFNRVPSIRALVSLPALTLTLLAVVHLLLSCFRNERIGRSVNIAVRSLAEGDRPCRMTAPDSDDYYGGEDDQWIGQYDEPSEQPLPDAEADSLSYHWAKDQAQPSTWPTQSTTVKGRASDDPRLGRAEEPSFQPFLEEWSTAHVPLYTRGFVQQQSWLSDGRDENGATSSPGPPTEGALGQWFPQRQHKRQPTWRAEVGLERGQLPEALSKKLVRFFRRSVGTIGKCRDLLYKLASPHAQYLTWMILRLTTFDMAALTRIPSTIVPHRIALGSNIRALANELYLYSQRIANPMFLREIPIFVEIIEGIRDARGVDVESAQIQKVITHLETNLAVSNTAQKYYTAVVEGLQYLAQAGPVEHAGHLVRQQLQVLEGLCTVRSIQLCRQRRTRKLIFDLQISKGSRPLIDIMLTPEHALTLPTNETCWELDNAVANAGGIFVFAQKGPQLGPTPVQQVQTRRPQERLQEIPDTYRSTPRNRWRVPGHQFPPSLQGQNLSMPLRGKSAHVSAGPAESVAQEESQQGHSSTSSVSLSSSAKPKFDTDAGIGGHIPVSPQQSPYLGPTPVQQVQTRRPQERLQEIPDTYRSTPRNRWRVPGHQFPPSLQGQNLSMPVRGKSAHVSAGPAESVAQEESQQGHYSTSSASLSSSTGGRRWSSQRHKPTRAKHSERQLPHRSPPQS